MTLEQKREKRCESKRRWYQANLDKCRKQNQEWHEANREKHAERSRRWYNTNPKSARRSDLKPYGLSLEEYDSLLAKQGGVCAICKGSQISTRKNFAVDHDHIDGHIRGLLCHHCNTGIGHFKDSPEIIASALQYVKQHAQLRLVS